MGGGYWEGVRVHVCWESLEIPIAGEFYICSKTEYRAGRQVGFESQKIRTPGEVIVESLVFISIHIILSFCAWRQ